MNYLLPFASIVFFLNDGIAVADSGSVSPQSMLATRSYCQSILPRSEIYQDAMVEQPGAYCVAADFHQQALYGAGHNGPGFDHALIELEGGDVVIDLQKHTLRADARSHGIFAAASGNFGGAEEAGRVFGLSTNNVTIKNGVIDLRGIGTGVFLIKWWGLFTLDAAVPTNLHGYEKTHFVLENLTIRTDNVGIQLEGDGNIVRNCRIESDGNGAVSKRAAVPSSREY